MQIEFQLFIYFEGFFLLPFSKKEKKVGKKDTIWETKTTFIIDFKSHSKQISPTTLILPPWAERKLCSKILTKQITLKHVCKREHQW